MTTWRVYFLIVNKIIGKEIIAARCKGVTDGGLYIKLSSRMFKFSSDPLLSHTMKTFASILDNGVNVVQITVNHTEVVKNCENIDIIHAALYAAVLDLQEAFDGMPHGLIWRNLCAALNCLTTI